MWKNRKEIIEIQTDHQFPARRPDLVNVNKINREPAELWILLSWLTTLKESKKKDMYQDLAWGVKTVERESESDSDSSCTWSTRYSHQRIDTRTEGHRSKRMSRDHPNYGIIEIGQNTKKSPGDLRRLVVARTPVKDHQLMWKSLNSEYW